MNKKFGVIGAIIFIVVVALGFFFDFPAETIIEIAGGAFGLCLIIKGAIDKMKKEGKLNWKSVVIIALAVAAGVLCALGGMQAKVFETISGLVLALLTVIFGLIFDKK